MLIYTPSGICPGVKLSYGRSIFSFLNTDFQQCYKSSFPQHPHQDLLFVFLMKAVLPGVRWNLSFHLYFLYGLRMSNILHVLISLCASLENCLFNSHGHLLIGCFWCLFLSSLYILDINPLSCEYLVKIFLPFCVFSCHFGKCFLCCAEES
jgi:hypothetical protein